LHHSAHVLAASAAVSGGQTPRGLPGGRARSALPIGDERRQSDKG
jgi:hypothetical protein